jgi:geranyl diphosphate synthase
LQATSGLKRAQELAAHHALQAADKVRALPPAASEHAAISRRALVQMTEKVLNRCK